MTTMKIFTRISTGLLGLVLTALLAQGAALDGDSPPPSDRTVSLKLFSELEELSRLVDISYCVGSTGVYSPFKCLSHCGEFDGFELVTTWNTGPLLSDSCGYIALSHPPFAGRIVVAFRGTYSLTNTIIDLSAVPQEYVPYPGDGDDKLYQRIFTEIAVIDYPAKCNNCTVHSGFWTSWKNTRDTVLSAVLHAKKQYPEYEIVLVGHSLGGAVAALAGLEMGLHGLNPQVTTFGEPRVGNTEFAAFINTVFNLSFHDSAYADRNDMRYRRVTHVNDPVPLLPLTEWGYASHAGEIYISKLNLPPTIADLEFCSGNDDKRCIAGAETTSSVHLLTQTVSLPAGSNPFTLQDPVHFNGLKTQFPLIPARYRLWELFFSHRDYFWRIGLCVPGGDPGSWRWGK
ncbi:putative extracellular triacylglycerol lipase [Talaromyces proteolyticus]|uniref:Extracellular triacylglycerol lipase n=1 Tax=Talaromyces proteolyticus TaxID=1131652 RepID=A0AAD4KM73_9EURO|nr:putative extracellular triacylglycerol lipase [Talaromyces proteolyticus]KAH8693530.1 putative extracellular triacylglycerol lipase [Talaromyces proteolyticus]